MFGKKGESKQPKFKKERTARQPITKERVVQGLLAFCRNVLLVLAVGGITVLAIVVYLLFKKVGGAGTDPVVSNAPIVGAAMTAGGGYLTIWLGRKWDMLPF